MTDLATIGDRPTTEKRPSKQRARITNRPRQMVVSGRTALGRRLIDLADNYAEAKGGWSKLTDTMAANVRRAAELVALSEQSRADALRNGTFDPIAVARLEGVASRAVRALSLPDETSEPEPMTYDEIMAMADQS